MSTKAKQGRTLVEYVRAKRREACSVCRLPDEIREQVKTATDRKINLDTVLAWLREEHGVELTRDEMTSHKSGHHDRRDA